MGNLFWQYPVTVAGLALPAGMDASVPCHMGGGHLTPLSVAHRVVYAVWEDGRHWWSLQDSWGYLLASITYTLFPAQGEATPAAFAAFGPVLCFPFSVLQQCVLEQVCLGIFLVPWSR